MNINKNHRYRPDLDGEVDFVVWGDSHARSLGNRFSVKAKELGSGGVLFAQNGGLPLLKININGESLGVVNRNYRQDFRIENPERVCIQHNFRVGFFLTVDKYLKQGDLQYLRSCFRS